MLGETLKATIAMRAAALCQNIDNGDGSAHLLFEDDFDLERKLSDAIAALRAKKSTKKIKSEDRSSQDESVAMNISRRKAHDSNEKIGSTLCGFDSSDEDSGDELLHCKPMFPVLKEEDTQAAKMPSAQLDLGASTCRYDSSDEDSGDESMHFKPMLPVSKQEDTQTSTAGYKMPSAKLELGASVSASRTYPIESKKRAVEVMPISFTADTTTSGCSASAKPAVKSEPAALVITTSGGDSSNPINLCLSDEEDEEKVLEEKLYQATSAEDWAGYEALYKQLENIRRP